MIPRMPTRPDAFRLFCGYRRPDLAESEFLAELGEVFMPGTPLMLRELGLAAYLPTVVPSAPDVLDLPDEVAVIAYASRERYAHARRQTVTGRMYTHTHRAVFDMSRSAADFAAELGPVGDGTARSWVGATSRDWQADGDVLCWVGHGSSSQPDLRQPIADAISQRFADLQSAGVSQCLIQAAPTWAALWFLLDGFDAARLNGAQQGIRDALVGFNELLLIPAARAVWRDDPPIVPVVRPSAWNLIFAREVRHFLE